MLESCRGSLTFFSLSLSHFLLVSNLSFFLVFFFFWGGGGGGGLLQLIVSQFCPVRNISAAETVPRPPLVFFVVVQFSFSI